MDTKLTLKLNKSIIERAKTYARKKNTSLSQLIESYLNFLTHPHDDDDGITPLVKSLSGIIELPKDYESRAHYKDHLLKKYSR
jgi:hypothetical protein